MQSYASRLSFSETPASVSSPACTLTRAGVIGTLVGLTLLFPGCGSGNHSNKQCAFFCESNNNYVYTANAGGNSSTISALASDAVSGKITPVAGSPYNDSGSGALAITKAFGGPLYVANNSSGNISAFTVDTLTGKLTTVPGSPFRAEMGMDSITTDPSATFLYAVTGDSTNLWAYSINSNGSLTLLPNMPAAIPAAANGSSAVVLDPAGKYLYVMMQSNLASNIYGFVRDSNTGALTALSGFPKPLDGFANKATFDPSGKFLLVAGTDVFGTAGGIDVFNVNSTNGALSLNAGSPVQVGDDPSAITFDALGIYLYVTNTADATISEFTFDGPAGTLSAISGSPISSGGKGSINGPLGIAVSSTDEFVYVSNASNDISVFTINSTGNGIGGLAPIAGSPFASGGNAPSGIVFVP